MTDTNTQPSTGNETLEERLKSLEREKRGILDDLKNERQQRQAYEKRIEEIENTLNSAAKEEPEAIDPQSEVNRLAQKPKEYILEVVKPELEARDKKIEKLEMEKRFDRAYQWLAKQEKKDVEEIVGSDIEKEIVRISKEHGMTMMDPVAGTQAAYKIFQQEQRMREEEESRRNQTISNNSTHAVRTPPSSGSLRFTRQQISDMPRSVYEQNREAILEAYRNGLVS